MTKIKIITLISIITAVLALYIHSLKKNIKLQEEINLSLQTQLNAVYDRNLFLQEDFEKKEKETEFYNDRYLKLQKELKNLSNKKENKCINEKVSEDLINLLNK